MNLSRSFPDCELKIIGVKSSKSI